ncbi:hypothetical protein VUR80DRAFT_2870 [Thermomyces stellatus]
MGRRAGSSRECFDLVRLGRGGCAFCFVVTSSWVISELVASLGYCWWRRGSLRRFKIAKRADGLEGFTKGWERVKAFSPSGNRMFLPPNPGKCRETANWKTRPARYYRALSKPRFRRPSGSQARSLRMNTETGIFPCSATGFMSLERIQCARSFTSRQRSVTSFVGPSRCGKGRGARLMGAVRRRLCQDSAGPHRRRT